MTERTAKTKRPAKRLCSIAGCGRPHKGRGYCEMHRHRFVAGLPMDPNPQRIKPVAEKRGRTSSGAVQLAYTLPPETAERLAEVAGSGYGATARIVRLAITQYLENRDTAFWRTKYNEERRQRMVLQQRLDEVRAALG